MTKLFAEIRRRKVFQTFVPYLGLVWLLLQVVSVVTPMFGLSPLFNTLVAVVLFAGMPVMLYLSWYFDFTAEGLVAIPDAKSNIVLPFGLGNWVVLIFITLGSGALAYGYFSELQIEYAKSQDGIKQTFIADSIAVLPFKDASSDQDQAFIAQGLAEEITSLLGRTNGLKVAASSSSSILADKGLDPVSIARRLHVDTILTGNVRVTGDQLKIRVELVNAIDAKVLWSETFARKFSDIFSVESEIARSTVNMLQDTYIETGSLTNSATTKSTDAYVIYLKGREQYRKQTTESMKEARKLFEQAIGLDPEYAQAYVALADTIAMLAEGFAQFGVLAPDVAAKLATQYLEKALVRQPEMADAYAVSGYIAKLENKPDDALSKFDKAISLNPSLAVAYNSKYLVLKDLSRHAESIENINMAYKLDPLAVLYAYNLAIEYSLRGDFSQSKALFEELIVDHPESPLGYAGLADAAFSYGNYALSLKLWQKAHNISPDNEAYNRRYVGVLFQLGLTQYVKELTDDPIYESNILLLEKKYNDLFALMDFQYQSNPEDPWIKFEAGWYQTLVGSNKIGISYILDAQNLFNIEEIVNMPWCSPAIEIAWALKQVDKIKESENISTICANNLLQERKNNIRQHELDYLAARLAALNKKPEEAIKNLALAVNYGWREWWTENDPLFSELKDMPEFQQQVKIIKDDLALQNIEALKLFTE